MKRILLAVILSLVLVVPCFGYYLNSMEFMEFAAEQLTPEQKAENETASYIGREVNKQFPSDTIVTSKTIKTIEKGIEAIIIKAGYAEEEYSIETYFCDAGHIHYVIKIESKTRPGYYKVEGRYFFRKQAIKPETEI